MAATTTPTPREDTAFTDAGEDDDDDGSPPAKRQRVSAACDHCRLKKIKCDACKPVCGPCIKRFGPFPTCNWGVRKVRGNAVANKAELLRLTRRIEELEQEKSTLPEDSVAPNESPSPTSSASPEDTQDHDAEGNAMMGMVDDKEQPPFHHYNDSSATSFMNQIKSLVDQQLTTPESQASPTSSRTASRRPPEKPTVRRPLPNYVLPSRKQADHLLTVYGQLSASLYPFLDYEEVDALYQRLWTGQDLGENGLTFLCLINAIFSIACTLDPSIAPAARVTSAEVFYTRAQELLQFDTVKHRSLLTVQCFLILGQYLQSTNDPQQCWIYVGFAIRIAQSLRLDIPSTSANEPPNRREIFRRVWHGCILMDQTLSMTFGRPAMITSDAQSAVPLPVAHAEGHVCRCSTERLSEESATDYHFFIETLKLYRLMNETLLTLYTSDAREAMSDDRNIVYFGSLGAKAVAGLLEMDSKLSHWYQSLPIHLRRHPSSGKGTIQHRQSNVLYIRYSHVRILLFRPVLARFCCRGAFQGSDSSKSEDPCLPQLFALQFSVACIRAALGTIDYFDNVAGERELDELDSLLPAWWYSIFYIYTAATVLVAARLTPALLTEVTEGASKKAWNTVMKILTKYQTFSKHAKRCSTALNLILNQVLQQDQQRHMERGPDRQLPLTSPEGGQEVERPVSRLSGGTPSTITAVHTQDWASNKGLLGASRFDDSSAENLIRHFNMAGLPTDVFGDMSWLTSMPSQVF